MNQRDLELLSSYLDGQLSPSDVTRLEARLKTDPQLASVLKDLRATRSLLRRLPQRRAPRNFTLTRKMVGLNPPLPRAYPFFRFASALATLMFVFSFGLNSVGRLTATQTYGYGMGGGSDLSQEAQPFPGCH
jgi:anti-sigma factor RsiW